MFSVNAIQFHPKHGTFVTVGGGQFPDRTHAERLVFEESHAPLASHARARCRLSENLCRCGQERLRSPETRLVVIVSLTALF